MMPSRTDFHGHPTYATWLMICWLSANRYAYQAEVILLHWGKLRSEPHGSEKARAAVAAKFERDVRANADIELHDSTTGEVFQATPGLLDDVDWVSIADKCLGRFQDYKELPRRD